MNKQEIYHYLAEKQLWHEIVEHKAIFNMAESSQIPIPYPGCDAKNLFVRDHKKRNYYLITVKGNKHVDLKEFRQRYNTSSLSFASESDLMGLLHLTAGSVTPLGVLNDESKTVKVFFDREFLDNPGLIGVHPNENTATVWMRAADLISLIETHGTPIEVISL